MLRHHLNCLKLTMCQSGENHLTSLRCTTQDKKAQFLSQSFLPYILIPIKNNESKVVKIFRRTIFYIIIILEFIIIIHKCVFTCKKTEKGYVVTRFWYTWTNLHPTSSWNNKCLKKESWFKLRELKIGNKKTI
jgi:hypothetical protein